MSLKNDFLKYQAPTTPFPIGLEIQKAEGNYIYDTNGKSYLDFVAGVSACTLGHRHPRIVDAMKVQIDKYLHVMVYGEYAQESPVKLSEFLVKNTAPNLESVYLTNSGTEAIEGALKLAKKHTGRMHIVSAHNAYHGATHGSLSLCNNLEFTKKAAPLLPGIDFITYNNTDDLQKINQQTAAVILETIQGAAGCIVPDKDYLKAVKKRCKEVGALLILDEIQPGIGRTGKLFAYEHFGITPDILVMGKGLGGGMPIGAFMASKKMMLNLASNPILGHITTFGGNPVIAAAALATLQELFDQNYMARIEFMHQLFKENLQHPKIKSIRGMGLMLACELESKEYTIQVAQKCQEKGLIVFWLLFAGEFLRISPPLTLTDQQIIEGCSIIQSVLDEM